MEEEIRRFTKFLARHFVAYSFEYESLNSDGSVFHQGRDITSGFVIEIHGFWFWVTAGHCIAELNEKLELNDAGKIRISNCGFVDFMGWEAKYESIVPYVYSPHDPFHVDDRMHGLDFGVVLLNANLQRLFHANGVMPITRANWEQQAQLTFDQFAVLGISKSHTGEHVMSLRSVQQIGFDEINVSRLDDVPSEQFFIGRILDDPTAPTMKGVSGGPIFGFRATEGRWSYHVVALQSSWIEPQRVIFGCSLPAFGEDLKRGLDLMPQIELDPSGDYPQTW